MECPEVDRTCAWLDGEVEDGQIASHVDSCEECGKLARSRRAARATVLDSELESPAAAPAIDPEATFAVGAMLGGRYRIVRFIARGGMGEVYEAFDEELRVRVALKVATRTGGRAPERFRREVMLARRVTHRNVCRLFEIGFEVAGGKEVPYCTMELLEGTTLSARLAKGPLAIGDALDIIAQIATGLQAAHDVGVIHRDFKSSNILLVPGGDGRERAVISDFGLARAEPGTTDAAGTLTTEQALVGTPAYMAPEQVECKPATPASDIYALGIVIFEMLTGELPFRGDTPMATAILRLKARPPSVRSRRPELGPTWDRVIGRCLELDPSRRYPRAADVALALEGVAPPRRLARWAIAGGVAGAAALALVLAHGSGAGRTPATAAPEGALLAGHGDAPRMLLVVDPAPDPAAPEDAWRATAVGELLRAELRVPGRVTTLDGDEAARLARRLASPAQLAVATPAQLLVTGALHGNQLDLRVVELATGKQVDTETGAITDDLAASVGELGLRLRRALAGGDLPPDADQTAKVLPASRDAARAYALGLARGRAFDHEGAIASLTRATELAPDFGLAYLALVRELRAVRQSARAAEAAKHAFDLAGGLRSDERLRAEAIYRESRKEWRRAADLWSTLLAADPDALDVASALARALSADHQIERCFDVLDQVRRRPPPVGDDPRLDLQEALCAREAGDFRRGLSAATRADVKAGVRGARDVQARALAVEGEMLANAGEYDRAIVVLDRAKQADTELGDGEGVLEDIRQLGFIFGEQGKTGDAEKVYREALDRAKAMGDRLAEGIIMNDFGQVLPTAQESLAMFQDGLAIAREQGDERLITALSLNLANKQDVLGKADDAIATYKDVIERATRQQDEENLATAEMNLSDTLRKLGRNREAMPLVEKALASFQERDDADGVGYALASRGELHLELGDLKAARADLEASLAQRTRLDEKRNIAGSQDELARLDLVEDRYADAEKLARASLAERRTEDDRPDSVAQSLATLGRALVGQGRAREALDAADEAEQLAKANPVMAQVMPQPSELAVIRGLADPAAAAPQLAIIRATRRPGCARCDVDALLDEAEIERAAGHTARATAMLREVERRGHAAGAELDVARATRLLSGR